MNNFTEDPSNANMELLAALKRVERAADRAWLDNARQAVERLAYERKPFTSESVLCITGYPPKGDHRALGTVFRRVQRLGLIKPTGRYPMSKSFSRHRAPIREWVGTLD